MAGLVVLESAWNRKGSLLEDEPSVLPYLSALRQSLAWEGTPISLVHRRFRRFRGFRPFRRRALRRSSFLELLTCRTACDNGAMHEPAAAPDVHDGGPDGDGKDGGHD